MSSNAPDVMALHRHALNLLYGESIFSYEISETWEVLTTVQKHLS